ncbi:MAG TPA: lipid A biosynthesis acyltransferase [Cyclobacteriaceae bacterium]|nr:lipid A biosynthesis acyltransferase [Cyclobacteriaceae bacterium]
MALINRLFYYGFVLPLSKLPFGVLYVLSDILAFLMYYVVGYRKKVVFENLKNSFPNKSNAEITAIAKKFYRHFCDLTLESLKMFSISAEDANKRVQYLDTDIPKKYYDQGKSIIVAMAHYNNWEFIAVTVDRATQQQAYAIYKPLTNEYFDKKIRTSRQKYGLTMMHIRTVKEDFEKMKNDLTATYFLIDQAPSMHSKPHWMTFLNQDTGVLPGTEKYAKDYNYPVVFLDVQKPKRGYYVARFIDVTGDPRSTAENDITEKTNRILEEFIVAKPEFWLWSHRRWKRKRV